MRRGPFGDFTSEVSLELGKMAGNFAMTSLWTLISRGNKGVMIKISNMIEVPILFLEQYIFLMVLSHSSASSMDMMINYYNLMETCGVIRVISML